MMLYLETNFFVGWKGRTLCSVCWQKKSTPSFWGQQVRSNVTQDNILQLVIVFTGTLDCFIYNFTLYAQLTMWACHVCVCVCVCVCARARTRVCICVTYWWPPSPLSFFSVKFLHFSMSVFFSFFLCVPDEWHWVLFLFERERERESLCVCVCVCVCVCACAHAQRSIQPSFGVHWMWRKQVCVYS